MPTRRPEILELRATALRARARQQALGLEAELRRSLTSPVALAAAGVAGALCAWAGEQRAPQARSTRTPAPRRSLLRLVQLVADFSGPLLTLLACVAPRHPPHDRHGAFPPSNSR